MKKCGFILQFLAGGRLLGKMLHFWGEAVHNKESQIPSLAIFSFAHLRADILAWYFTHDYCLVVGGSSSRRRREPNLVGGIFYA